MLRLIIILLSLCIIPFCLTEIYNYFYNKHINKQINENSKKSWISPIAFFCIVLLFEFIILIILYCLFSFRDKVQEETFFEITQFQPSIDEFYSKSEIDESIYSIFDGSDVKGYKKNEEIYGNFEYTLYTNDYTFNKSPQYVLIIHYTGNKDYLNDETILVKKAPYYKNDSLNCPVFYGGISHLGLSDDKTDTIYFITDLGEYSEMSIDIYLFDKLQSIINDDSTKAIEEDVTIKKIEENAIEKFSIKLDNFLIDSQNEQ